MRLAPFVVFTICLTLLLCAGLPASAYLIIHPENPHYFQETLTGKPVMIASCAGFVPTSLKMDYKKQIQEMKDNVITYGRVWHFLPWGGSDSIWPWSRSDVSGAPMGGNKIDMEKWNPEYWRRMKDGLSLANKAGIYSEIHLFDRCGMSPPDKTRWQGNPWASDNNVNNLETPVASKEGTPDFYMYEEKPNLRAQQERYITKMIDETVKYPIVIYEVENEHWAYNNPKFGEHYAKFIKDYIAQKYPKMPRLVSYSSLEKDLEEFYKIPAVDIVNRHYGNEPERNPAVLNDYIEPRWKLNKAINIDEFANGVSDTKLLREMCWIIVTSGGNFHIEDCTPESKPMDVCGNIRLFRTLSKWDFIHAAPDKGLITSGGGYCMAQPGVEYVCYFPVGGEKVVQLPAGEYRATWWDTVKGGSSNLTTFTHAGGAKTLTTPTTGDWVLHISRPTAPKTTGKG